MKKFFRRLFLLALLAGTAAAATVWWPVSLPAPVVFFVEPGRGGRRTARDLTEAGILRAPQPFEAALLLRRGAGRIKAGEYEFAGELSAWDVAGLLLAGRVKTYKA